MKLTIKKEYFDMIKEGMKSVDYRDAHITFVCDETKETLTKKIVGVELLNKEYMPPSFQKSDMFDDDVQVHFLLED